MDLPDRQRGDAVGRVHDQGYPLHGDHVLMGGQRQVADGLQLVGLGRREFAVGYDHVCIAAKQGVEPAGGRRLENADDLALPRLETRHVDLPRNAVWSGGNARVADQGQVAGGEPANELGRDRVGPGEAQQYDRRHGCAGGRGRNGYGG